LPYSAQQLNRWNTRRRKGRFARSGRGLAPAAPPVTFPATPMFGGSGIRVQIALGADLTASWLTWNWLDITDRVRVDMSVQITNGRRDGAVVTNSSECLLRLSNTDGYLSRLNPNSPWYGQITKLTPVWIQVNPGSGFVDRYHGYFNASALGWSDLSGTDSFVTVRCGGVMRRLAQGDDTDSSLTRTIAGDAPLHYWRIDDPTGSSVASSSVPNGGVSLTQYGTVDFGFFESPPGGDGETSAPRMKTGYLYNHDLSVAAPWTIEWAILRPSDGTTDGPATFGITFLVGGRVTIGFATAADATVSSNWHHYKVEGVQNGANYEIYWWKNGVAKGLATSGAGTLGALTEIDLYGGYTPAAESGVAYTAIYSGSGVIDAQVHSDALQAYAGEMAHVRVARLCRENGIPVTSTAATSVVMGPQPAGKLIDLLRECEAADQGFLFEREFGIEYRAISELYDQPVTLALDFDSRHVMGMPQPADDDQRTRNRWTVSRSGGISTTVEQTTGTMGTGPGGPGVWKDSATVNVEDDDQLASEAGWRVHIGTVDDYRLQAIPLKLHGTPDLIPSWLSSRLGQRISLANPPAQMVTATAIYDLILEGYTEAFNQNFWAIGLNTAPFAPYVVGVAGDSSTRGSSAQAVGSTLSTAISTSDTSLTVATSGTNPVWTTSPVNLTIIIDGETMTVSAISGASSPQTFTVTRSVNGIVKAHAAGATVLVYRPLVAAL